jgi:hypothetical protein
MLHPVYANAAPKYRSPLPRNMPNPPTSKLELCAAVTIHSQIGEVTHSQIGEVRNSSWSDDISAAEARRGKVRDSRMKVIELKSKPGQSPAKLDTIILQHLPSS